MGSENGPRGHLEIERKYEAGPDFTVPDLTGLPGVTEVPAPQVHHLAAVYYDTGDLRLAAAKITLRRRTGGSDAGWHLKLPAGPAARREVHAPLGEPGEPVPERLTALVAGLTAGRPLRPIALVETTRTVTRLSGPGGRVLAEVSDDLVTGSLPATGEVSPPVAGRRMATPQPAASAGLPPWREAARWREVEAELGAAGRDLLDAVGDRLLGAGARPSPAASKLGRLLAARSSPPAGGPPEGQAGA